MTQSKSARMEAACSLLAAPERRYLLYQLADRGDAPLDDLVTQIAAWKDETTPAAVERETRQRVYVSLVHNHLPRLADYDIVDYDLRSGDVVVTDGYEDVEPLLEQFRQTESIPEIRDRPALC